MTDSKPAEGQGELFDPARFQIANLDDEMRADRLLGDLLRHFFTDAVERCALQPEDAGRNARGADYFLREFIIGDRRENIYKVAAERVRQFAGNWYIVRNLEPNLAELGDILDGVAAFYSYLGNFKLIPVETVEAIVAACGELDFYGQRIEGFWQIEGDGYQAWNAACPLPID